MQAFPFLKVQERALVFLSWKLVQFIRKILQEVLTDENELGYEMSTAQCNNVSKIEVKDIDSAFKLDEAP